MEVFDLAQFGVPAPFLVRKLNRHWEWDGREEGEDVTVRASVCYENAFRDDEQRVSLYEIRESADLAKVAVGLNNSGVPSRSRSEPTNLVAFAASEIVSGGLTLQRTKGSTGCVTADHLHYEVEDDRDRFVALIEDRMRTGRPRVRLTKGQLKQAIVELQKMGCRAASDNAPGSCDCESLLAMNVKG